MFSNQRGAFGTNLGLCFNPGRIVHGKTMIRSCGFCLCTELGRNDFGFRLGVRLNYGSLHFEKIIQFSLSQCIILQEILLFRNLVRFFIACSILNHLNQSRFLLHIGLHIVECRQCKQDKEDLQQKRRCRNRCTGLRRFDSFGNGPRFANRPRQSNVIHRLINGMVKTVQRFGKLVIHLF